MIFKYASLLVILPLALACELETPQGTVPTVAASADPPAASAPAGSDRPTPDRSSPNVLLITMDTTRADRLGVYGYEFDTSPNLDALARDSVVFDRAIAAASVTAPSHASIFTSKYTREHSIGWINGATRLGRQLTMAELFASAGYATGGFVGNYMLHHRLGFDRGFDLYDDELPSEEINREVFERTAEPTTRRAMDWLSSMDQRPIFLWVHLQDPHGPYTPPPGFAGTFRVDGGADEEPLPFITTEFGLSGVPTYQQIEGEYLPSLYESRYAGEIFYADHWIGELLTAFERQSAKQGRERVVMFTSDHGESMGEGYRYFVHGQSTTPDVAHVPMILFAPGIAAGRRREIVSHVDVMPTLLEFAGIHSPNSMSGIALGPFLRAGEPLPDRIVYCDIGRELSAYRSDSFLRVKGVGGVWLAPPGLRPEDAPAPSKSWKMYKWKEDGSWERSPLDSSLKAPIRAYSGTAVMMSEAPPLVQDDVERMRSLGYVVE